MQATGTLAAATPEKQMNKLVTATRRREVTGHRPQRAEAQACLFFGFAVGDFLRLLILVDQPGDQFDQPGIVGLVQRTDAELLDQHHFVTQRIVGQHADGVVAHEQLAADLAPHATGEQFMAQAHLVELVEALEAIGPFDDLDRPGHRIQGV